MHSNFMKKWSYLSLLTVHVWHYFQNQSLLALSFNVSEWFWRCLSMESVKRRMLTESCHVALVPLTCTIELLMFNLSQTEHIKCYLSWSCYWLLCWRERSMLCYKDTKTASAALWWLHSQLQSKDQISSITPNTLPASCDRTECIQLYTIV